MALAPWTLTSSLSGHLAGMVATSELVERGKTPRPHAQQRLRRPHRGHASRELPRDGSCMQSDH